MKAKIIIGLILLALVAVLCVQNTKAWTFHIYFWEISASPIILVPLALILGFVLGYLVAKAFGGNQKKT